MTIKKKILVLGSSGMLGYMVYDYLKKNSEFEVNGSVRSKAKISKIKFDAEEFVDEVDQKVDFSKYDYIVNCIGIIKPFCQDNDPEGVVRAIKVNALFPHKLSKALVGTKVKVIQIATDCVYSGQKGGSVESDKHDPLDVYGKTKSLGEVFAHNNFLNIRCSIIGPEDGTSKSLLEWFLHQKKGSQLQGFEHHKWNGVTTLQFAKLCEAIIQEHRFDVLRQTNHVHHFVPNSLVSKYELLNIFNEVFEKNYKIKKVDDIGPAVDRSLGSNFSDLQKLFKKTSMKEAIQELRSYLRGKSG
jgi:dTDP-4-dehydrorhamnose reductase